MNVLFSFFLRLFICFIAAKLLVRAVDLDSRLYLLSLTGLFLINAYLFEHLVFRDRKPAQQAPPLAAEQTPKEPPPTPGS